MNFGVEINLFDLVILGGNVNFGDLSESTILNIGITDEKVTYLGNEKIDGKEVIDASGYEVTPGFIDLHTHSDISFIVDPDADSKLVQGVTFELMGNCGMSFCAPLSENNKYQLQERLSRYGFEKKNNWDNFDDWLGEIEKNIPSINVAAQIGHGNLRSYVMGMEARQANPEEIARMQDEIQKACDQGILGFSTGLWYAPGSYSSAEEIIELAKTASKNNILYSSHIRSESDDSSGLFPAHSEAIEIARRSGVRVQISHVKSVGPKFWGRGYELIEGIEKARNESLDIAGDQYPYHWSSTPISGCMFPRWSLEGGRTKTLNRMQDLNVRESIKNETTNYINRFHGPEGCVLADYAINPNFEGLNLLEISKELKTTPEEAVMQLYEKSEGSFILHSMDENDVDEIAKYKYMCVASDGNSLRNTGPLSSGKPHPRSYGTNTRFIEQFVSKKKIVNFQEAIFRMTSYPAERLSLKKRGKIALSYFADINIFKINEIKENATYVSPHQYSGGMKNVIVNGKISVENGKKIKGRNGKVVRSFSG
tara:strand:- start:1270 stop:2886 length:1617 start_codon:yes stop_codon:yes gene_type:complete